MISSIDVVLPHYTFQSFAQTAIPPDFTFYVDDKIYKCQTILICAISKVINTQISSQKPLYEYRFKDLKDPHLIFEDFISLLNGGQNEINQNNAIFLNYIAKILGIESLFAATRFLAETKVTTFNALSLLVNYADNNIQCPEIIKFIQANWKTIKNDESIYNLSLNSLKFLFKSPYFKQSDTDWYLKFVSNLISQRGKEFSILYSYLDFSKISNSSMCKAINQVSFDSIPIDFIYNLESRFIKPVNPKDFYDEKEEEIEETKKVEEPNEKQNQLDQEQKSNSSDKAVYKVSDQDQFIENTQPSSIAINKKASQPTNNVDDDDKYEEDYNENYRNNYNSYNNYNYNSNYNGNYNDGYYYEGADNFEEDYIEEEGDDSFYHQPPQKLLYRNEKDLFKGVFNYIMSNKPHSFRHLVEVRCGGDYENRVYKLFNFDDIWSFNWNTYSKKDLSILDNAWITIRFPYHKLCLSHYTLASSRLVNNRILEGLQPKSWRIEGSDDMEQWTLLSLIKNSPQMSDVNAIATFPVNAKQQKKQQNYFSCFKLTLINNGANQRKPFYDQLKLNAIEFYGVLINISAISQ